MKIISARGIVAAVIGLAIVAPIVSAQQISTPDAQQDRLDVRCDDGHETRADDRDLREDCRS
jgi:hypothetical protein